jgi:D-aminopeptidase
MSLCWKFVRRLKKRLPAAISKKVAVAVAVGAKAANAAVRTTNSKRADAAVRIMKVQRADAARTNSALHLKCEPSIFLQAGRFLKASATPKTDL